MWRKRNPLVLLVGMWISAATKEKSTQVSQKKSRNGVSTLLLLSRLSRVWLCATPQMAARQAPPSLGFSRQEHWSGLPFPSPMHESEKRTWSCSCDHTIPLLHVCQGNAVTQKDACSPGSTAALFTTARTWMPAECPSRWTEKQGVVRDSLVDQLNVHP